MIEFAGIKFIETPHSPNRFVKSIKDKDFLIALSAGCEIETETVDNKDGSATVKLKTKSTVSIYDVGDGKIRVAELRSGEE